ncbi:hypothetical protein [Thermocrinis sp.]|jgi:hypothetical protein|uniref:hypothetical protein n=1 Tax=Thermocrinis sp. TaxID=2024383 RepID=UPI003C03BCFB
MMTHVDKKNNIALRIRQFNSFFVLDLAFYEWYWIREWEIISVKHASGEQLYEVKKYERDGDRILAVVVPWEGTP